MADNNESKIAPEAKDKLLNIFRDAVRTENFGNERFVRNLIEKAEMNRASRLAKMDASQITHDTIELFAAEDFEYVPPKAAKHEIGFVVNR